MGTALDLRHGLGLTRKFLRAAVIMVIIGFVAGAGVIDV